ncbi:RNA methyltransferase, TrmH family [Opisthorchis viverrini]|uniref:rRNA methyltransferase 1, mitochondrial n=1 Tax=Opisthorchis viverrini TaxID=6198 RepID=A0A1S8WLP7_OPIVI|nr:RNA methyltransferase, TrmH family [Opisthorchis viverrini]
MTQSLAQIHLLYGLHPVLAALTFRQRNIKCLHVREDWIKGQVADGPARPWLSRICEVADHSRIPILPTSSVELGKLVNGRAHQGVVLETDQIPINEVTGKTISHLLSSLRFGSRITHGTLAHHRRPISLLLDHLTDVMNVGSIFRTAAFFGACAVFLSAAPCVTPSNLISKLSVGAMESLLFYRLTDTIADLRVLSKAGFLIVGTAGQHSSESLDARYKAEWNLTPDMHFVLNPFSFLLTQVGRNDDGGTGIAPRPLILVLGNESTGISQEVLKACDLLVRVVGSHESAATPLSSIPSSLNVAVATGILFYHLTALRHRTEEVGQPCFSL